MVMLRLYIRGVTKTDPKVEDTAMAKAIDDMGKVAVIMVQIITIGIIEKENNIQNIKATEIILIINKTRNIHHHTRDLMETTNRSILNTILHSKIVALNKSRHT